MFPGSIVPQAFNELLRIVRPGGYLIWNVADGYEDFNEFFSSYNLILNELVTTKKWKFVQPVKKIDNMLFEDSGYVMVSFALFAATYCVNVCTEITKFYPFNYLSTSFFNR